MPLMNLKNCVQHAINLTLAPRCMSSFRHCRSAIRVKKVSRITQRAVPAYFKQLRPCRTDEKLRAHSSLGYPRCHIPYRPECLEPCYNMQRSDAHHYRPSRSLDRDYQVNWVDCVPAKIPTRCRIERIAPEIKRRTLPMPRCLRVSTQKCRTLMPVKCRPFTPASLTSDERCIKFPLSQRPQARLRILCKLKYKTQTSCKRPRTRYPSFSECHKDAVRRPAITECAKDRDSCPDWKSFEKLQRRS